MCATCVFFRGPPFGLLRSRRGCDPGGISQPVMLKFLVYFDWIPVRIESANRQSGVFYAMSFVLIVAVFALIGQMLPVQ